MELVLTIEETAVLLRVSVRTIKRHIAKGEIETITFGKTVRIPVAQFNGLLDEDAVVERVRGKAAKADAEKTNEDEFFI